MVPHTAQEAGMPERPRKRKPSASLEGNIDPIVFPPKANPTHTFIMLHGRGDSARNVAPQFMFAENSSNHSITDFFPGMKFIFPTAKRRRVSCDPNRSITNQWFDIASLKNTCLRSEIQIDGLRESSTLIHEIICEEMDLIPCENIILGGLSQGCATALYALLTFEPPPNETTRSENSSRLGAVIGMSGWLPFRKAITEAIIPPREDSPRYNPFAVDDEVDDFDRIVSKDLQLLNFLRDNIELPPLDTSHPAALRTPVFLGHGTADEKVDIKLGDDAATALRALGLDVTWSAYEEFGHWWKEPDEMDDMIEFLCEKMDIEWL